MPHSTSPWKSLCTAVLCLLGMTDTISQADGRGKTRLLHNDPHVSLCTQFFLYAFKKAMAIPDFKSKPFLRCDISNFQDLFRPMLRCGLSNLQDIFRPMLSHFTVSTRRMYEERQLLYSRLKPKSRDRQTRHRDRLTRHTAKNKHFSGLSLSRLSLTTFLSPSAQTVFTPTRHGKGERGGATGGQ